MARRFLNKGLDKGGAARPGDIRSSSTTFLGYSDVADIGPFVPQKIERVRNLNSSLIDTLVDV